MTSRATTTAIFVLTAAFYSSACNLASGPGATVRAFHLAVSSGNVDAAIEQFSPRFVNQMGIDKLRKAMTEAAFDVKRKGGVASVTVDREDIVGDVAEVVVTIKYGNGQSATETVKLARENGEWKIQSPK